MRCYNGAPDSQLQALLDVNRLAHEQLAKHTMRATYFPAEGKWMVFDATHRAVTDFHDNLVHAANVAIVKVITKPNG